MDIPRVIKDARYALIKQRPYLAVALMNMRVVPAEDLQSAMAVDARWNLYYHPDRIGNFTSEQVQAALYHEVWHLLGMHFERLRNYSPQIANIGGDLAINSQLDAEGWKLPDGVLRPSLFGFPVCRSAEWYCEQLNGESSASSSDGNDDGDDHQDDYLQDWDPDFDPFGDDQDQDGDAGSSSDSRSSNRESGDRRTGSSDQPDHASSQSAESSQSADRSSSDSSASDRSSRRSSSRSSDGSSGDGSGRSSSRSSSQSSSGSSGQSSQVGDSRAGHNSASSSSGWDGLLGDDHGSCVDGRPRPYEVEDGLSESVSKSVIRQVAEAIRQEKLRGNVPAYAARWAEEVLTPRIDWRSLLRAAVVQTISNTMARLDYTWCARNRRQALTDVILPTLRAPVPKVSIIVDTSGSMGNVDLAEALGVIRSALQAVKEVTVYSADTEIHTARKVFSANQVQLIGGGGTSMKRAVEQILEDRRRKPDVVVIVTDGYTDWPDRDPKVNMVAVLTSSSTKQEPPSHIKVVRLEGSA